jgi:hypothetical protein
MRSVQDIQADLTSVLVAIQKVLVGQEYSLDTGQSKQFLKRADLKSLTDYKYSLQSELSIAIQKANRTQLSRGESKTRNQNWIGPFI